MLFYQPANLNLWLNEFVMKIMVHATDQQFEILLKKGVPEGISLIRFDHQLPETGATAYFDLFFHGAVSPFDSVHAAPVFVNAVNAYNSDLALRWTNGHRPFKVALTSGARSAAPRLFFRPLHAYGLRQDARGEHGARERTTASRS